MTSSKMNLKRPRPRHIIIKLLKDRDKERILKAAREKQLFIYKGSSVRLTANFTLESWRPEAVG